jgi:hypothetical protein
VRGVGHDPALLIGVFHLTLHKFNRVEVVDLQEPIDLVELVHEEEQFLAVEFEFEVGHAEVDLPLRPLQDAVDVAHRNAFVVQPEEGVHPRDTSLLELDEFGVDAETETAGEGQLETDLFHANRPLSTGSCYVRLGLGFAELFDFVFGYLPVLEGFDHFLDDEAALAFDYFVDDDGHVYLRVD